MSNYDSMVQYIHTDTRPIGPLLKGYVATAQARDLTLVTTDSDLRRVPDLKLNSVSSLRYFGA